MNLLQIADGSTQEIKLNGWKKQAQDSRDAAYSLRAQPELLGATALPKRFDNTDICSPVENQGSLGSCTANAVAGLVEANENKRRGALGSTPPLVEASVAPSISVTNVEVAPDGSLSFALKVAPPPVEKPPSESSAPFIHASRLFQYYTTRTIMRTVGCDSGASIRDSIKATYQFGIADEAAWPYSVAKYRDKPPQAIWDAAAKHKVTSYHAIADGDIFTMKAALVDRYLVAFGFSVYTGINVAGSTGNLSLPKQGEKLIGGHAVCLVGYDDERVNPDKSVGAFLVRNSWGTGWGLNGYFWMPYNYVGNTKMAKDFWVVKSAPI